MIKNQWLIRNKWIEAVVLGLIACACVIPSIFLFRINYANEFVYIPLVRVAASVSTRTLVPLEFSGFNFIPEHQGLELITLLLTRATRLPIEQYMFLPICGILLPLSYYLLSNSLGISKIPSALLSLAISLDPTIVMTSYNSKIYGWTRVLFVLYILIYSKVLRKKKASHIMLLLLVFISVYTIYWTDPLLMIAFSIFANLLLFIEHYFSRGKKLDLKDTRFMTISLTIIFIIIFFFFGSFIYTMVGKVSSRGGISQMSETMISFSNRMLQIVGLEKPDQEDFSTQSRQSIVGQIQFVRYILIVIPVIILAINLLRKKKINKFALDKNTIVLLSLSLMIIFHLTIYSTYGHPSTRNLALFGPLIALLALQKLTTNKGAKIFYALLLSISLIPNFVVSYKQVQYHSTFDFVAPAASWLEINSPERNLNADLGIYGMITVKTVENGGVSPTYVSINPNEYKYLIGLDSDIKLKPGILVIDKLSKSPLVSTGWGYQDPLSQYILQLGQNSHLEALYDNESIRIYKIVP
jgi:hypothetical protein